MLKNSLVTQQLLNIYFPVVILKLIGSKIDGIWTKNSYFNASLPSRASTEYFNQYMNFAW